MGNYYGGSSIVTNGTFTTHDPAEDRSGPSFRSKTNTFVRRSATKLVRKKADTEQQLHSARINLLHSIAEQVARGRTEFGLPRKLSAQLKSEIEGAGTAYFWARGQSAFEDILARHRKKLEKKVGVSEPEKVVSASTKRMRALARKRDRLSRVKKSPSKDRAMLMNYLIDQMVARREGLKLPKLNPDLGEEVRGFASPLAWLKAQPSYESFFEAGLLRMQLSRTLSQTKQGRKQVSPRKRIKRKVQKPSSILGELEKAPPVAKPIADVPVSFILRQIKKESNEALDIKQIDWGST